MSVEYPVFNFQEDAPYELIRCSICNGQLKDPRMLPCLHTFCLDCLEDYVNVDCQGSSYQEGDCDNFEQLKSQTAVGSNGGTFFSSIMSRVSGSFVPSGPTIMEVEPKDKEEFPCPICRKRVTIPADGLSKLPINVFLEKFLQIQEAADKKDDSKVPANSVTCEVCQNLKVQGSGSSVATRFCVDCNQHLCQRCVEYHRLLNTTNSHKLVSLGSQLELLHRLDDVFCRFHKSEKLEVYCRTCGTGECRICFASPEHLGHSGCGIVEAEVDLKRKLIEGVEDLCCDLEIIERNLKEVAEISDRFNTGIDNVENGVQNKEDEMKEVLMRHAMKLKRDIDDRKRSFNRELERVKDCLEKHKVRVEQSTKYTNLVLKKASSAILVCSAREICKRLAELRKMSVPELACELEPIFTPSKLATEVVLGRRMSVCGGVGAGTIRNKICSSGDTVGTEENLIGFLEFKTKYSRRTSVVVTMTKSPVVLQSLPCTDYAIAMALISDDENDFLCCATYSSDDVLVCDATAFDKKKASTSNTSSSTLASSVSSSSAPSFFCKTDTLKVAGLKNAFSMTVVENHLFVTEWKSDMVHKIEVVVDIGVDNEVASTSYDRWSLGTGEGLNCLSNTKDNRFLLVTCPEVASLTIVDVNGHLKRKIPLDFSIDKPSESLQLNDDDGKDSMFVVQQNETSAATAQDPFERYVVSHSGNNLDRVCLIDGTGKVLATYGTLKGGPGNTGRHNYNANYHMKQQQLNGPYRMATDLVNNLVFVSDHYNHRIILLSSIDLKPIRELITPTFGLSFPLDLLFDTKRQLLHVADLDNKRFVTFTFQ